MLVNKVLPIAVSGMMMSLTANAQLFETRSTRFSGDAILDSLKTDGSEAQINLRDSMIKQQTSNLAQNDTIETYFDGYYMGLVVYRDRKPHNLLGFWDPEGKEIDGGRLTAGNGTVKTPFNPDIIANFKNESVVYVLGIKNGACFYYCDCAGVLRKGTFKNNQKEGLWKEYSAKGVFIKQKQIVPLEVLVDKISPLDDKWLQPAHCMMKNNNDIKIECPKK
jgi:hypothetical protein